MEHKIVYNFQCDEGTSTFFDLQKFAVSAKNMTRAKLELVRALFCLVLGKGLIGGSACMLECNIKHDIQGN